MTAFNIGDRVAWPTKDGWHFGDVVARRSYLYCNRDGHKLDALELTVMDDESGRLIDRDIRGCCALIPGEHLTKAEAIGLNQN